MTAPERLKEELVRLLGKESVSDEPEVLLQHSADLTENPSGRPALVVRPVSAEQVVEVVKIAASASVPITPMVANTNLGGLANPPEGAIVVDLRRMNRIIEVNPEDMFAVIEPGVTWQQLHDHLEKNHPQLRFAYPLSPPDTGIVPNCLMDGLANLSLRVGAAAGWINALEVVLPDGRILRTGHWAVGSVPCTRSPFPALEGLFVGFAGRTGIVTRMAVQLWPRRKLRKRCFLMVYDIPSAFGLLNELARSDLLDDIGCISLAAGKMLFGEPKPLWQDTGEPSAFVYLDYSADEEILMDAKQKAIDSRLSRYRAEHRLDGPLYLEQLLRLEPRFNKFADFPTRLDFLLDHPGGGLTWVGTYGPTSRFAAGWQAGSEIMARFEMPRLIVCRPMQGGHFGVLRFISTFDKSDSKDVEKVRNLNAEIADALLELGFFPYKTPQWVWSRYAERLDPVFCDLVATVQRALDPSGIMNPGKLELPHEKK